MIVRYRIVAILAQGCHRLDFLLKHCLCVSRVFSVCVHCRQHSMPRKGWTQIEVPHGWTQLIRGVRPKSEVASCGAQSVSRSRCRVTESGPAWSVASTDSEGKSRGVPTCSKTTHSSDRSRSCSLWQFERSGGHHVARIIEVRTSCSSGSAATRTV